MEKTKKNIRLLACRYWYAACLLIVVLFCFRKWFFSFAPLTQGDWYYYPIESLKAFRYYYFNVWLSDQSFGRIIIDLGQAPSYAAYGLLAKWFNISYPFSERLVHMWPTVLAAPIFSYFYLRHFSKRKIAIGFGTIAYCCNTYFLQLLTGDITLASAYAIAPLVLFFFIKHFDNPQLKTAVAASLSCLLLSSYEPRVLYVIVIGAAAYGMTTFIHDIRFKDTKKTISFLLWSALPLLLIILLNTYWLVGVYLSGGGSDNSILSRGLFGNEFFKLENALTIFQPFWTGHAPVSFVYHSIPFYEWLLPLIALAGLYVRKFNKLTTFCALLICLGILLGKQISAPLTTLYPWLYNNAPGFNAFREASKFYVLIALGYSALFTLFAAFVIKHPKLSRSISYSTIIFVGLILTYNLRPFVINDIGTTFVARSSSDAYLKWNKFIDSTNGFSRTLWAPSDSRWASNTLEHPSLNLAKLNDERWQSFGSTKEVPLNNNLGIPYASLQTTALRKTFSKALLDSGSIRYVIVPIRDLANDDDFFENYGDNREDYIKAVSSINGLTRLKNLFDGLAVYENKNYKPYFNATTQVNQVGSLENADNYYTFGKNVLGQSDLNFVADGEKPADKVQSSAPRTHTTDIFERLAAGNVANGMLRTSTRLDTGQSNTLYSDAGSPEYDYQVQNGAIDFTTRTENVLAANGRPVGTSQAKPSAHTTVEPGRQYSFAVGNTLNSIDARSAAQRNIGATNEPVTLYSSDASNLVPDGSFEQSSWQHTVEDCNKYDNSPNISMSRDDHTTIDGRWSLKLGASRHTACSRSRAMTVQPGQTYQLAYKYFIQNGQRAGYDLVFNDAKHTVLNADQINGSDHWYRLNTTFTVPASATNVQVRLKGYPDDRNQKYATTNYDAVRVTPLKTEARVAGAYTPAYQKIDLGAATQLTTTTGDNSYTYRNLITNPSLEQGLWQNKVGDCNSYDDKPVLGMTQSNQASQGSKSLELQATRHVACTSPPAVKVQEGKNYLLSFDYQSPNSKQAGYYVSFNDAAGTSISQRLDISGTGWQHFSKSIRVPYGATSMNLSVYSYADDYGATKQINRYDNFSFVGVPNVANRYFLVSQPRQQLAVPQKIDYQLDSPTRKHVQIHGARTSFYLNMSESYNNGWRLELDDTDAQGMNAWSPDASPIAVAEQNHLNMNGFLNSWYVNPEALCERGSSACTQNSDGSYNIRLVAEFTPQRYFYVGLIISGTTLAACLGYLAVAFVRRRKERTVNGRTGSGPTPSIGDPKTSQRTGEQSKFVYHVNHRLRGRPPVAKRVRPDKRT